MKVFLFGSEFSEGISKKTGKPFDIGNLYGAAKLDPSNPNAQGHMGTNYECTSAVVRSISNIPHSITNPLEVELEIEDIMRYGQKKSVVIAIHPVKPIAMQTPKIPPAPSVTAPMK